MPASASSPARPFRPRLALFATSLGFVLICLDVTVVNVALGRMRDGLGLDSSALEWVVNAYTLAFASLLLSTGALADRFGARRVFVAGFAVFTLASIGCGLSGGAAMLIASRLLQGVGAALCVPSSLALLGAAFPEPHARARAVGIWAGTAALALGAGPLVGGVLVAGFGWPAIFLINVPVGIAGIWLTLAHAPDTERHASRHLDLTGQALAVVALAALTYALVETGRLGWNGAPVLAGFAVAAAGGALFVAVEARHAQPLMPLSLFGQAAMRVSALVGLFANFGYYGLMFAMSLFFQGVRHDSPLDTGLAFLPMTAMVTVANLASGALTARLGYRVPMVAGQALAALGYFLLVRVHADSGALTVALPMLAVGVGTALVVPSINTAVLMAFGASRIGVASGVLNTARQIGGVVGVGVFGALVRPEIGDLTGGLHAAAIVAGVLTLGGMAIAWVGLRPARAAASACGV